MFIHRLACFIRKKEEDSLYQINTLGMYAVVWCGVVCIGLRSHIQKRTEEKYKHLKRR